MKTENLIGAITPKARLKRVLLILLVLVPLAIDTGIFLFPSLYSSFTDKEVGCMLISIFFSFAFLVIVIFSPLVTNDEVHEQKGDFDLWLKLVMAFSLYLAVTITFAVFVLIKNWSAFVKSNASLIVFLRASLGFIALLGEILIGFVVLVGFIKLINYALKWIAWNGYTSSYIAITKAGNIKRLNRALSTNTLEEPVDLDISDTKLNDMLNLFAREIESYKEEHFVATLFW